MWKLLNKMNNRTVAILGICLVAIVAILAFTLPDSAWVALIGMLK